MKNATQSVSFLALLAALWAVPATSGHAQTDDDPSPGGAEETPDAPDEGTPPVEGEPVPDAAGAVDDGAADDGAVVDGATQEDAVDDGTDEVEPPVEEPAPPPTTSGSELTTPSEQVEPTDETVAAPAAEEEAAPPAPEPLPWRNTFFSWTNQVSFNSFFRDSQLSYNPVYQQAFAINPRWYLGPATFLWANLSMQVELTDSDGDALNRDPQFADVSVDLRHVLPWEGFIFIPSLRVSLPTSKASLAAQRYVQLGAGLTAVRAIDEIGLTIAGLFRYSRWFAGSNVVQVGEPQPDRCPAPPPATPLAGDAVPEVPSVTCDQLGDTSAASDILLYGVSLVWTPPGIAEFSVNVSAFLFTTHGYALAPAYIDVETREDPLRIDDGSPSHWNNFTYFAVSIAYQFTSWMNLALGIQNSGFAASAYNPDGSIRNPLFTPDTQVFLSATLQIDDIYTQLAGSEDDGLSPEERQRRRQGLASTPGTGGTF